MPPLVVPTFVNRNGQAVVEVVIDERRQTFLTIGGEKAFQTGLMVCDTCRYIFSKLMPAQRLTDGASTEFAEQLSEDLRNVAEMPGPASLGRFGVVLAPGDYSVVLARLTPSMVMPGGRHDYFANDAVETWGLDPFFGVGHSPNTPYYRLGTTDLGPVDYGGRRLGVVLGVPLYPPTQAIMNRQDAIADYRRIIKAGSSRPTVLALGLAEDRGPATWDEPPPKYSRHLIATLFILDGHHKLAAAAAEGLPIQLLVFFPHQYAGSDWREPVKAAVDLLSVQSV